MKTTETKIVKIADIKVGERKRQVNLEKLKPLKESIQISGLMQPIILNSSLKLIAGNHRLEAFKALGKTEIPAIILDADELQAELMEIDENLVRKSLSKLEQAEQIARRKELYEQLHPESTKEAIVRKNLPKRKDCGLQDENNEPNDKSAKTFVKDTAEQTGMSERDVQQNIQNAKNITPEAKEKIKDTPLANKSTTLAKLSRTAKEKQIEVVEQELEKLKEPRKKKAENKTEKTPVKAEPVASDSQTSATKAEETPVQAEIVSTVDNETAEKELDIGYKVDFIRRKVAVDGKWLDLPPEYNMDGNSYNNMIEVVKTKKQGEV